MKPIDEIPPSGSGKEPLLDYDNVYDNLYHQADVWFEVGEFPYEQAVTAQKTLLRRGGIEAHVRGKDRAANGPAKLYARYVGEYDPENKENI